MDDIAGFMIVLFVTATAFFLVAGVLWLTLLLAALPILVMLGHFIAGFIEGVKDESE